MPDSATLELPSSPLGAFRLGVLPIVLATLRKLKLAHSIDQLVPSTSLPSPGTCVEAMLLNLFEERVALYQMETYLHSLDTVSLFGPDILPDSFTDDRLARTLDKLFESNLETLHSHFISNLIDVFSVSFQRIHTDTTSLMTYGAYEMAPEEPGPHAEYGYSKDHRSDLKQFLFGLTVQENGIPLCSTLINGNQSDGIIYRGHLEKLRGYLKNPQNTTYIGDSKLCDAKTLGRLRSAQLHVTTLLPKTFKLHDELQEKVKQFGKRSEWKILCETSDSSEKEKRYYKGVILPCTMNLLKQSEVEGEEDIEYKEEFQAVIISSPILEESHKRKWKKEREKRKFKMEVAMKKCRELTFKDEKEAELAASHFIKGHKKPGFVINPLIVKEEKRVKTGKKGRPSSDAPLEITYYIDFDIKEDEKEMEEEERGNGLFILITSKKVEGKETLQEYQEQYQCELGFRWLKTPAAICPLFLHTPKRIEAMAWLFTIALTVYMLIQWRMRKALQREKETIPGHNKVKTSKPTMLVLIRLFWGIQCVRMKTEEGEKNYLIGYQAVHDKILKLLDLPPTLYHSFLKQFPATQKEPAK